MTDEALRFLDVVRLRGVLFEKKRALKQAQGVAFNLDDYGDDETAKVVSIVGQQWLASGLPCLHLGHKLAASMLFSDVGSAPDLPMPWAAFAVYVPPGILEGPVALVVAKDRLGPSDEVLWIVTADHEGTIQWVPPTETLREIAERATTLGGEVETWSHFATRLVILACAELAVYRPSTAPPIENRSVKRDKRTGEPCLWNFQLTRPVNLDLREELRAWAASRRSAEPRKLTVQSVVRGHYKTQPHGPKNSLRKWMYIEPHRRGDFEAPTAERPHLIGRQ